MSAPTPKWRTKRAALIAALECPRLMVSRQIIAAKTLREMNTLRPQFDQLSAVERGRRQREYYAAKYIIAADPKAAKIAAGRIIASCCFRDSTDNWDAVVGIARDMPKGKP